MKTHVAAICGLAFVCQKNIEPSHFKRVFFLVSQPFALQSAQQFSNTALGDPKAFGQATHVDALVVLDCHDGVDFSHVDVHICAKLAALAFYFLKARNDAQQCVTDGRAAGPMGGLVPQGFDHGLLDAQFNRIFDTVFLHGLVVWRPYVFVNLAFVWQRLQGVNCFPRLRLWACWLSMHPLHAVA